MVQKSICSIGRAIKYIKKEQGNTYAGLVLIKNLEKTRLLEKYPNSGKIEPLLIHKKTEYRFLIVWSFKIIYKVESDRVIIARVFHTSRDPKKIKGV